MIEILCLQKLHAIMYTFNVKNRFPCPVIVLLITRPNRPDIEMCTSKSPTLPNPWRVTVGAGVPSLDPVSVYGKRLKLLKFYEIFKIYT